MNLNCGLKTDDEPSIDKTGSRKTESSSDIVTQEISDLPDGGSRAVKSEGSVGVVVCEYVGSADVPPSIVVGAFVSVSENELNALISVAKAPVTKLYWAAMIVKGGLRAISGCLDLMDRATHAYNPKSVAEVSKQAGPPPASVMQVCQL